MQPQHSAQFTVVEVKKTPPFILTLKGLGSIHQVSPVQGTICPVVRQGHQGSFLQLLLLLLPLLLQF